MLADESADRRMDAACMITEEVADDPRCRAVLWDRSERDPTRRVRRYAADLLYFEHDDCDGPPALEEIAWMLQPTGQPTDEWFAMLADESAAGRIDALRMITEEAADDPRCQAVLVDRLERDSTHSERKRATS